MLFKNAHIVDPASGMDDVTDIVIENDRIARLEKNIVVEDGSDVYDINGLYIAPSFFDPHVHFRDFGEFNKECYESAARAALRGGYTTCVAMANTVPPLDRTERFKEAKEKIKDLPLEILQSANITIDMKGEELVDFEALINEGAIGFTDDGIPLKNIHIMEEALELSKKYNVVLSLHEEDPRFIQHAGYDDTAPRQAETEIIKRDIELLKKHGGHMHVQHLTSREGVELIREAKKTMDNITCEVTPSHLFFTKEDVKAYGTLLKVNPPVRTEDDRQALIEGLVDGTIDMIATDHAPHTEADKNMGFYESKSGIITLETAFPTMVMKLLEPGHLSLYEIVRKMSTNPRKLYNRVSPLKVGEKADIVILDPKAEFKYSYSLSKSKNTPLLGHCLRGSVVVTMKDGIVLYNDLKGGHCENRADC